MIQTLSVTHYDHLSARPFEATVAEFEARVGSFETGFSEAVGATGDAGSFADLIRAREGSSGFMRFLTVDHGAWLAKIAIEAKSVLYILGNPLVARTMLIHDPGVGLYVPVRLSIHEDRQGAVHVTYDLPSTLMSGLDNPAVTEAASKLDALLIALGDAVAGAPA